MAAIEKTPTEIVIDLESLNVGTTLPVLPYNEVVYQAIDAPGGSAAAFSSGVITVERSVDGVTFVAMGTPLTIGAAGIGAAIDVSELHSLRFRTSTAGANEGRVRIALLLIKETN